MPITRRALNSAELTEVSRARRAYHANPAISQLDDFQLYQLLGINEFLFEEGIRTGFGNPINLFKLTIGNGRPSLQEYRTWSADQCMEFLQANGVRW